MTPKTPYPRLTADSGASESYYGLPMLKRPLWGWEIALSCLSEGISSGSFVLGTMAELFGDGRHQRLTRHAHYLSLATLIPCPPLLIADLGRPERFHHMLRVVKLKSPMSVGAWAIMGFSGPVALLALKHFARLGWIPSRLLGDCWGCRLRSQCWRIPAFCFRRRAIRCGRGRDISGRCSPPVRWRQPQAPLQ